MSDTTPDEWLTVSQAAARLGVSERTVRRRCETGKLVARLVANEGGTGGRAWLIDRAATNEPDAACGHAARRPKRADACGHDDESESQQRAATRPDGQSDGQAVRPERAASEEAGVRPDEMRDLQRQADRMQGYLAGQMEATIARAVREAVEAAQAPLVREIEQLRAEVAALTTARHEAPQRAENAPAGNQAAPAQSGQQRPAERDARPLWKVILGIR
jgi:excisionase family DNA binding protein